MTGNIFLLGEDGNLKELREEPYDSEELLQRPGNSGSCL